MCRCLSGVRVQRFAMPTVLRKARRASPTDRDGAALWLVGVGATMLLLGAVLLVLPTSTHQDVANVGEDIFFDCGGALYPGARPPEEPGLAACREVNDAMLRWGLVLLVCGAGMATGGRLLRQRARRQQT